MRVLFDLKQPIAVNSEIGSKFLHTLRLKNAGNCVFFEA